ncbi:MAG: acyloxyacyl hydrolase [Candidatus Hydrogenedentes bacterium]|nr:acyloxyacyl hydrolase [Candidatus Hydrogenedentota bacterium]
MAGWDEGRWQLELSGGPGISTGSRDRGGDVLLKGSLEYEIPTLPRLTVGLRMLPVFVYWQDVGSTVYGGGAGLGLRLYAKPSVYRGLFAEANVHALAHKNQIKGNGSNINFLTGVGVGYRFSKNWHTVIRYEHISNAGLDSHNSGADCIILGFGYTF